MLQSIPSINNGGQWRAMEGNGGYLHGGKWSLYGVGSVVWCFVRLCCWGRVSSRTIQVKDLDENWFSSVIPALLSQHPDLDILFERPKDSFAPTSKGHVKGRQSIFSMSFVSG